MTFFLIKFAYNNIKNINISHISFELNYRNHLSIFYKKDLDSHSRSKTIEKLFFKL